MTSKIMELASYYGICVGETYGNPEDESRERARQALRAAVNELETDNARLERNLAGTNKAYIELCAVSTTERNELRTRAEAAEAKLAALEQQEPPAVNNPAGAKPDSETVYQQPYYPG